MVAKTDF